MKALPHFEEPVGRVNTARRSNLRAALSRIWCYFRRHRPLTPKASTSNVRTWTSCERCGQLMVGGYYGWQRANANEEAYFRRTTAKSRVAPEIPAKSAPPSGNRL